MSAELGRMQVLWLGNPDTPGPDSLRGYVERNAIALLSGYDRSLIDPPSETWLGRSSGRDRVRRSGRWNSNHVGETPDTAFLDVLARLVAKAN